MVSLKQHDAAIRGALVKARSAYAESGSAADAVNVLSVVVSAPEIGHLVAFADEVWDDPHAPAEVVVNVATALEARGRNEDAEAFFRRAVEMEAGAVAEDGLAQLLIRTGRAADAWEKVHEILDAQDLERRGVVSLAIRAFQGVGNHDAALELLEAADARGVEWRRALDTAKLRAISEADAGRGRGSGADLLDLGAPVAVSFGGSRGMARYVGPAVAVLAIGAWAGASAWIGANRRVYLVNGLADSYAVEVNGRKHALPPYSAVAVRVSEGEVRIGGSDNAAVADGQSCTITTGFWGRPFTSPTFVINPDGCAVLVVEDVVYGDGSLGAEHAATKVFSPRLFHTFGGIEDRFTEPPATVQVSSSTSSAVHRDALSIRRLTEWYGDVVASIGEERANAIAATVFRSWPRDTELLRMCGAVMHPQEYLGMLTGLLGERPLLVDVHREWQLAMQTADPMQDLEARYRQLAAELPGDAGAEYLLAGVCASGAEARSLLESAGGKEGAAPLAVLGLARSYASRGEWEKALERAESIRGTSPWPIWEEAESVSLASLVALKRYGEALSLRRHAAGVGGMSDSVAAEHVVLMVLDGRTEEAEAFATGAVEGWVAAGANREVAAREAKALQAHVALAKGDMEQFAAHAEVTEVPAIAMKLAIERGEWTRALAAAEAYDIHDEYAGHAALYIAATRAKEGEVSMDCFEWLLRRLGAGTRDERRLRDWLTGTPCGETELREFSPDHERGALLLAVLGTRQEGLREACVARGRPMLWDPCFPGNVAREVLGE